jgi:hypothetical protein
LSFGGGQEARAQSGGRKYGFANSHGHKESVVSNGKVRHRKPN